MDRPRQRRWGSLTGELDRAASPVKAFFTTRYPNVKEVQRRYREEAGPLILPGSNIHPGTVGGAFDWAVCFAVHAQPDLRLPLMGAQGFPVLLAAGKRNAQRLLLATMDLAERLGVEPAAEAGPVTSLGVERFQGPGPASTIQEDVLLRGCWVLQLLTELYRMGPAAVSTGSALWQLNLDTVTADDLLALAPPEGVADLAALLSLARTNLLQHLTGRTGLWATGPTFAGAKLMHADADIITAGLLVELKTGLGDKRPDGTRRCGLDRATLYQLIGYVLLDFDDEFDVNEVALYAARYGYLAVWQLQELLHEIAGRPVRLADEREELRKLLAG